MIFEKTKQIILLHSITWPNFMVWSPLLSEILVHMCLVIVSYPGCEAINFEIDLTFLIKFSLVHDQSQNKN